MKTQQLVKMAVGAALTLGAIALVGQLSTSPTVHRTMESATRSNSSAWVTR
jgi:hypothetical protein